MEGRTRFDAYFRTPSKETFIEVRHAGTLLLHFRDRLYVMLSKLSHYADAKKSPAQLTLILADTGDDALMQGRRRSGYNDRVLEDFQPAVKAGLLRIETVSVTTEEIDELVADGPG